MKDEIEVTTKYWTPDVRNAEFYGAFATRLDSLMREFYPGLIPAMAGKWKHDKFCPQELSIGGKSPCSCVPEIELTIRLVEPRADGRGTS